MVSGYWIVVVPFLAAQVCARGDGDCSVIRISGWRW